MDDLLAQLTPEQALEVVRRLYKRDMEIHQAIMEEAKSVLEAIDLDETAEEVFFILDSIAVQDLRLIRDLARKRRPLRGSRICH